MRLIAALVASAVPALGAMPQAAIATTNADDAREWSFKVFLDDREIGFHDFRITPTAAVRRLESVDENSIIPVEITTETAATASQQAEF